MKKPKPVKSFNGISVALLRGALGHHYMKDWTEEQIKEYKDWVSTNTQAFIFVKPYSFCVAFLTKQIQNCGTRCNQTFLGYGVQIIKMGDNYAQFSII